MVTITVSVTPPVNNNSNNNNNESSTSPSSNSTPPIVRLSHDDLWTALVAKARHPEEFVLVIEKASVVREHEDGKGLTRRVLFRGEQEEVEEVVRFVGKMRVCVYIYIHICPAGETVTNSHCVYVLQVDFHIPSTASLSRISSPTLLIPRVVVDRICSSRSRSCSRIRRCRMMRMTRRRPKGWRRSIWLWLGRLCRGRLRLRGG